MSEPNAAPRWSHKERIKKESDGVMRGREEHSVAQRRSRVLGLRGWPLGATE